MYLNDLFSKRTFKCSFYPHFTEAVGIERDYISALSSYNLGLKPKSSQNTCSSHHTTSHSHPCYHYSVLSASKVVWLASRTSRLVDPFLFSYLHVNIPVLGEKEGEEWQTAQCSSILYGRLHSLLHFV